MNKETKSPKLWSLDFETVEGTPSYIDYVQFQLLEDRQLFLTDEISDETIKHINTLIIKFNHDDEVNNVDVASRKKISLHINSYGGSCYDGQSVINQIITSKTPIVGYCSGYNMSMGLGIFAACHERIAYPYTTFMYHELSSSASGRAEEIKRATQEYERLQKMYDHLLISRTQLTQKKLNSVKKSANDWYFDVKEAKKIGLVHTIIGEELLG